MCKPALAKDVKDIIPRCIGKVGLGGKDAIILTILDPKNSGYNIDISGCIGSGEGLRNAKASAVRNLRFLIKRILEIDTVMEY